MGHDHDRLGWPGRRAKASLMGMHRKVVPTAIPVRPKPDAPAPTAKKITKMIVSGTAEKNGSGSLKK